MKYAPYIIIVILLIAYLFFPIVEQVTTEKIVYRDTLVNEYNKLKYTDSVKTVEIRSLIQKALEKEKKIAQIKWKYEKRIKELSNVSDSTIVRIFLERTNVGDTCK